MTAGGTLPELWVGGSERHGVVGYARELARAVSLMSPDAVLRGELGGTGDLHVHFTDRLFGASPGEAADAIAALARGRRLTVTLHDLPQRSDGEFNLRRRSEAYRRVVAVAHAVAVNSRHEAHLIAEFVDPTAVPPRVIPLGWQPASALVAPALPLEPEVGIVGFVYPGKGHREVIDALARAAEPRPAIVALGMASPGHEGDVADLGSTAAKAGVRFELTGYLAEPELLARCARVAVPIAAHQHVSASASVLTWMRAGRRALVPDSRYWRELAELRPGTVTLYDPTRLDRAIRAAMRQPLSTFLDADAVTAPTMHDAALQYVHWWREVLT